MSTHLTGSEDSRAGAKSKRSAWEASPARLWGGPEIGSMLQQAVDALDLGLLVLAPTGRIVYYNRTYARLRGLAPGALLGQPLEALDRRRRVRELLSTGALPPERGKSDERRIHQETIVPVWEGGRLCGVVVAVSPVQTRVVSGSGETRRRPLGPGGHESLWPARYTFADIIGQSPALVQTRELARQAAQGGSSVLIIGESGTGKELFAHAIHAASPRHRRPLVPVDCSAIPRELLESELFGYAPGAFTGASREGKVGKFELANGGTIFLDEIGEMPLEMQSKLLRVLQEKQTHSRRRSRAAVGDLCGDCCHEPRSRDACRPGAVPSRFAIPIRCDPLRSTTITRTPRRHSILSRPLLAA